jgi:hypothetical protein
MRRELRQNAESVETHVLGHVDHVVARVDAFEIRVREQFEALEMRMREHTETVETRWLREFWKWAKTADARYRQHQGVVNGLSERVSIVEERLTDLEQGNLG